MNILKASSAFLAGTLRPSPTRAESIERLRLQRLYHLVSARRGFATSLLEATATIAVGATLAAAALGVLGDKVTQSRVAAAQQDVKAIAEAITNFFEQNTFFPFFASTDTHRNGLTVDVLKSKNGDEAETFSPKVKDEDKWTTSSFDFLEHQLVENTPGFIFFGFGGEGYPVRGELSFDPKRGWDGPYLATPPPDPWGNKYYVNIKFLHPDELDDPPLVSVLSAGPNETIQTAFTLSPGDKLDPEGDDIAERVR